MKKNKLLKTLALTLAISSVCALTSNSLSIIAYAEGQAYWQQINNNWYYKDSTGNAQTGWIKDNGFWYYLDSNGAMKTGWLYDSGNWYYLWSNGQMATDTTVGGYYLNSSGAWTTSTSSSGTELTGKDISQNHTIRGDIAQSAEDNIASKQLTNSNLDLSANGLIKLNALSMNLAQGRTIIDEARNNCIGKVVDGKYKITDIKFFDQSFLCINTGTNPDQKIKAIQNSNLSNYKSSSPYKHDVFLTFTCGNERGAEWEAIRVVVELEAI